MRFLTSGLKSLAVAAPFALALPVLALVDLGEGGEFAGPPAMAMAGQVFPGELTQTSAAAQAIEGEKRHPGTEMDKLASWRPGGRDEDGAALPNKAMPGIRAISIDPVNLDDPKVEYLVTSRLGFPEYIALDAGTGKMYWTDWRVGTIQRADLDGSTVEDLVTDGLTAPRGITLDVSAGKMYWTEEGTATVRRANLDGTNVEDLVRGRRREPGGIALDVTAGKMYWVEERETGSIQRANLDGTNMEES